jgi:hypothetical protein
VSTATSEGLITEMLGRVVEARAEYERANAAAKAARIKADDLERKAADALASIGIDSIRCHGMNWKPVVDLHVSAVQANRDKLIEAAKSVKLDAVAISTSKIKAWLIENYERRCDEGTAGSSYSEGTAFDGLVSEYREVKLSSRKVS